MQPINASPVHFSDRIVLVTVWSGRGLAVVDPLRQVGVTANQLRTWIAHTNTEIILHRQYLSEFCSSTPTFRQTGLTIRGYASFLDPSVERPGSLNDVPNDYIRSPAPVRLWSDIEE